MTTFLNYIATEPEVARLPIMVDSSRWSVLEDGPEVPAGKGVVNSISLKEGEESFLAAGAHGPPLRRGRRRDGVRRAGPGRHGRAQGRDLRPRLRPARRASASRPRTSSSTRTCSPSRPGSRSTTSTRRRSSRRSPLIKERCPGSRTSGGISNLSFSFRGNDRVREAMHSAFLYHAIQAGLDMGIVNAGQLVVYEDIEPELRERVEDVIFNRRDDATERLLEYAERVKGEGTKRERRPLVARGRRRAAADARARPRHRRLHRGGHRGGAAAPRAPARRDRRAAHARHAGRRRPLRQRQDVPPAGRQERARDEARRRVPRAVHGGGEAEGRLRRPRAGQGRPRDGQGRRARHRQEHRRRRARLQQLRGDRPRRDGAVRQDPRHRARRGRGRRRALRADHAVARRDGQRRARDGAARPRPAAADRRRDDVEAAHRREDRARVLAADGARARRVARRRRRRRTCSTATARPRSTWRTARCRTAARAARRARAQAAALRSRPRARTGTVVSFDDLPTRRSRAQAHRRVELSRASASTSTGSSSSTRGS